MQIDMHRQKQKHKGREGEKKKKLFRKSLMKHTSCSTLTNASRSYFTSKKEYCVLVSNTIPKLEKIQNDDNDDTDNALCSYSTWSEEYCVFLSDIIARLEDVQNDNNINNALCSYFHFKQRILRVCVKYHRQAREHEKQQQD